MVNTLSRRVNRFINWENTLILCLMIISFFVGALILVVGAERSYIWVLEKKQELELSNAMNKEIVNIMNLTTQLKIDLTDKEKKELENIKIKSKYDAEELRKQQKYLINYQGKLASSICPVGSYVALIKNTKFGEIYTPVRVNGHEGYEALTYEGECFMTIEQDKWKFLSRREYQLLGGKH